MTRASEELVEAQPVDDEKEKNERTREKNERTREKNERTRDVEAVDRSGSENKILYNCFKIVYYFSNNEKLS